MMKTIHKDCIDYGLFLVEFSQWLKVVYWIYRLWIFVLTMSYKSVSEVGAHMCLKWDSFNNGN